MEYYKYSLKMHCTIFKYSESQIIQVLTYSNKVTFSTIKVKNKRQQRNMRNNLGYPQKFIWDYLLELIVLKIYKQSEHWLAENRLNK